MKYNFTKLRMVIIFVSAYAISSCSVSRQAPPMQTAIPPTAVSTQIPTETPIPEPSATQTQTPGIVPDWQLVWSDEFSETEIDRSVWSFDIGPVNDTVQYFTDRPENARVVDGILEIIALKESFSGYEYTAALLNTRKTMGWRYGRIEARIRLPRSNGLVPAFWMMPTDSQYGWWPYSGEIDIMEHPTNQVDMIYGTVHTGAYSAFTGSAPRSSTIQISDAETEFHIYAIEWTEDRLNFYVDDQNYFTIENDHSGFGAWPFDQRFYMILSMGVGGGWVGNPDSTSVFPAIMEVDYVRVYQGLKDVSIYGPNSVTANSHAIPYTAPAIEGLSYKWQVPESAQIISGQGTNQIEVDWGTLGGNIQLELGRINGAINLNYPVEVSTNLLMNGGFEKGVNYWRTSSLPAGTDFVLTPDDVYAGSHAVFVNLKNASVNAWDVELSQGNLALEAGDQYLVSLWAKADGVNPTISLAIINPNDFTLYGNRTIELSKEWAHYEMAFTVPINVTVSFNIDMGKNTGGFYFDDISLTMP